MDNFKKWFWERHSNKWGVITRFIAFFLVVPAVWFHNFKSASGLLLFLIFNFIFFPKPARTDNFFTKSVFGEEMWFKEDAFNLFQIFIGIIAFVILLFSAYYNLAALTIIFFIGILGWKILFMQRMAQYYDERKSAV